jgi:hypothetical protein
VWPLLTDESALIHEGSFDDGLKQMLCADENQRNITKSGNNIGNGDDVQRNVRDGSGRHCERAGCVTD